MWCMSSFLVRKMCNLVAKINNKAFIYVGKKKNLPLLEDFEITGVAAEGKSLGRWNDMVVFVPYGAPGDIARVKITRKKHSFCEGVIDELIKPSVVQQIHDADTKAGATINPDTPVCLLRDIVAQLDLVLLMSVNPGFGGQKFIPNTLNKVRELRALIAETGSRAVIEVDGGVNDVTGMQLAAAGADVLVAGNYVFKDTDPLKAIETLCNL